MTGRVLVTGSEGFTGRYVTAALERQGWQVIAACEIEFFLLEDGGNLVPPMNPKTGRRLTGTEILSLRELDGFDLIIHLD